MSCEIFRKIACVLVILGLGSQQSLAFPTKKHSTFERSFNHASLIIFSLKAAIRTAETSAEVGNYNQAIQILENKLKHLDQQSQAFRFLLFQPQTFETLHFAKTITETNLPKIEKLTKVLGIKRTQATQYLLLSALLEKIIMAYSRLDSTTYPALIEDCESQDCPSLEILSDQVFSAQRSSALMKLATVYDMHQKFSNSELEVSFAIDVINQIQKNFLESQFKKEFSCLSSAFDRALRSLKKLRTKDSEDSPSIRADKVILSLKPLGNRILSIHHRESCIESTISDQ